jgi:hypothetical protein
MYPCSSKPPSGNSGRDQLPKYLSSLHNQPESARCGYNRRSGAPGRTRTCDLLLRSSFCGRWPPAAFLVTAGLLGTWLLLDVCSFRPVLAHGWHGLASSSRTVGAFLLRSKLTSSARLWVCARDGRSARGLLYLAAVRTTCASSSIVKITLTVNQVSVLDTRGAPARRQHLARRGHAAASPHRSGSRHQACAETHAGEREIPPGRQLHHQQGTC